jgi:CRISPR type III-A/MTUBE-associated protein Csm2
MDKFWEEYSEDLMDGYFRLVDNKKSLKSKYIVEYPEELARKLASGSSNKLSQIWKFYDHVLRIQDNIKKGDSLEFHKSELCELLPAVNYAKQRKTVTWEFERFIKSNVQCIYDEEDLKAFMKHFQSLIAYLPRQNQK